MNAERTNKMNIGFWPKPVTVERNRFVYKSLSSWACNISVGCAHSCRFCYVPSASTNKLAGPLGTLGVQDPDSEWGEYVFVRQWNDRAFIKSIQKADATPDSELNLDGNRAVIFCSTTDPYQVLKGVEGEELLCNMARALNRIRDLSTLNVRILTRSPLARRHFHLLKGFGNRLLFGMSLPTLDNRLARLYEPHAPAPTARLETLRQAKETGIPIYVAMAPTYPEQTDLAETLEAIAALNPVTVFHEPINIRAENVQRIAKHGEKIGVKMDTSVFTDRESWARYSMHQLTGVQKIAEKLKLPLHLWPDKSLGAAMHRGLFSRLGLDQQSWLHRWWDRVSEWPGQITAKQAESTKPKERTGLSNPAHTVP